MTPDLPRVLRRALGLMHFASEAVDASATSIFLYRADDHSLHGLISDWDWTRTSFPSSAGEWPSVTEALATGEPRCIDAFAARGAEAGWFEARGIVRTVCVPLRDGKNVLGVIFFDFAGDAPLGKAAMALLGDVGRRCARALARSPVRLAPHVERWTH